VISLFAAALFAGSGVATAAAAPLAEVGSFDMLYALAALVAVPLGLFAGLARRRYSGHVSKAITAPRADASRTHPKALLRCNSADHLPHLSSLSYSPSTNYPQLRFRASLTEDGARRVILSKA
jgi:hypothetical protein